jgi:hypothetical protein
VVVEAAGELLRFHVTVVVTASVMVGSAVIVSDVRRCLRWRHPRHPVVVMGVALVVWVESRAAVCARRWQTQTQTRAGVALSRTGVISFLGALVAMDVRLLVRPRASGGGGGGGGGIRRVWSSCVVPYAAALGLSLGCVAAHAASAAARAVRAVRRLRVGDVVRLASDGVPWAAPMELCVLAVEPSVLVLAASRPNEHFQTRGARGTQQLLIGGDALVVRCIRANAASAANAASEVAVAEAAARIAAILPALNSPGSWAPLYNAVYRIDTLLGVHFYAFPHERRRRRRREPGAADACLDALAARWIRTQHAARLIQRAWRAAIADPRMRACRRRLMREFNQPFSPAPERGWPKA